jgi:hypothetical protein
MPPKAAHVRADYAGWQGKFLDNESDRFPGTLVILDLGLRQRMTGIKVPSHQLAPAYGPLIQDAGINAQKQYLFRMSIRRYANGLTMNYFNLTV